ncbi:MAG: HAD family hydrolase [Myxococcaceae bacterium]
MRLLAIDLDGTLLRRDKTISPVDRAALERARRSGVKVALVTGRLLSSTLAIARELELQGLMVCADGGLVLSAATGEVVARSALEETEARRAAEAAELQALGSFALFDDAIHFDRFAAPLAEYASGWTRNIHGRERLLGDGWVKGEVLGLIHFGGEEPVYAARRAIDASCGCVRSLVFPMPGGQWALKLTPAGVDKASGLARVAAELGIAREEVVAVGDWLNDVPMLRWAGRSFAMGQSLEEVRQSATEVLEAAAHSGGGIAEVVTKVLGA